MRHGVGAIGGVQEEHTWLAIVVGLLDDFGEEVAGFYGLVDFQGDVRSPCLLEGAFKIAVFGCAHVWEDQVPVSIRFHGVHEVIGNAHRDVEIGDLVFVGLTGDEIFHIRVVDAQNSHIGAAARAALGYLAEGVVVHP